MSVAGLVATIAVAVGAQLAVSVLAFRLGLRPELSVIVGITAGLGVLAIVVVTRGGGRS